MVEVIAGVVQPATRAVARRAIADDEPAARAGVRRAREIITGLQRPHVGNQRGFVYGTERCLARKRGGIGVVDARLGASCAIAEAASCGVSIRQRMSWVEVLGPKRTDRVVGVFERQLPRAGAAGWVLRD